MTEEHKEKFNINYQCLRRHYRETQDIIGQSVKASRLREQAIQDQIYQDIETVRILKRSLNALKDQLTTVQNSGLVSSKERKEIRDIIHTLNKTLELLLKYSDKIEKEPKEDEETLFRKMIECMKEFPSEYQMKFIEKWKSFPD